MTRAETEMRFPAEAEAIRAALEDLRGSLAMAGADESLQARVELVLAEVLNNIAKHAYGPGALGPVTLRLSLGDGGVSLILRDQGVAMPGGILPKGRLPDLDVPRDALPEGGFGWHIIRKSTWPPSLHHSSSFSG